MDEIPGVETLRDKGLKLSLCSYETACIERSYNYVCIEPFDISKCSSDKLEINSLQRSDGMLSVAYQARAASCLRHCT